jgi:general secretion pathway protein F
MPVYEYKGLDGGGKATSGMIDADSQKSARAKLRKQGLFPTEVREQAKGGKATSGSGLNRQIDISRYLEFVTARDIATITVQMAVLIGASIPMAEALAALVEQAEKSRLKIVLSEVKEKVNEGGTLADALKVHPDVFDELYIHMVRAGEQAGALDVVLKRLAEFTEAQVKLQGKITSALAYPVLMTFIGAGILGALFIGVIPRVRGLFDSFGGEKALPFITRAVFFVGDTLTSWWILVPILAVVGAIWGFRAWVRTKAGRRRWDAMKLTMPIFGKVNRLIAVSRFARTLSTLLVSGVPIMEALRIVRDVVGNAVIAEAIDKASDNIREGQSIAVPLKASGEFPPMVTHMITIGEKTGELERMLGSVADAYDDQVEQTMSALTSLLAPLAIVAMGGVVFLVAIGLLSPMMNLSSMIR